MLPEEVRTLHRLMRNVPGCLGLSGGVDSGAWAPQRGGGGAAGGSPMPRAHAPVSAGTVRVGPVPRAQGRLCGSLWAAEISHIGCACCQRVKIDRASVSQKGLAWPQARLPAARGLEGDAASSVVGSTRWALRLPRWLGHCHLAEAWLGGER